MAISVKNHEDRIVALEKKIVSSAYSETIIWTGNQFVNNWSSVTLTVNQSVNNFHFLLIKATTWRTLKAIIAPVSHVSSTEPIDVNLGGDSNSSGHRNVMLSRVSNTQLKFAANDIDTCRIYKIIGVKFSNVILYYVSNIIYIKFKRSLNLTIAIFNRLFLHKIFSRRCKKYGY